ncbi:MAG: Fe-S cluster assembly protein NifU, partial [Planctomycetota bacterium]
MWDYTDKVMDQFHHPHNVGKIDDPDGVGEVGSLACGDALTLMFKLDGESRIQDVKFQTFGCASAIASSSVLTEMIKGMTLEEAAHVTNKDIVENLGGLPDQKMHCSVMGQEALEAAIADYYTRKGGTPPSVQKGQIVCTCFGITDDEIRKVVHENDLTTVEEVTNFCKAGGGCGGCKEAIGELIEAEQGQRAHVEHKPRPVRPAKLTNIQKIQLIQETINEHIRPALRADGGDI